ncbi:pyridoxamine 5'-phosphate oxidase family protein [Brachyspira pilosicoli]|uniref:pyridoxamine 5'-phosphate oxidase family protein n=1 Tax=Brachyspira pilosicoli TaxID=52584 RepID=UPI001CA514B5|nr:pyridoxamine 5'-phosphate oxidase family protein [Brachyspira pilosicoli]MBW5382471.1 antibiotic resistance protein [Brachyspira pilosicoli]
MRRKEFNFNDKKEIENMLNTIEYGVMALPDKTPYCVPISFCYKDNEIYFHGAPSGRKYELLKNNPKVSFTASKPYSYIPSTFNNNTMIPTQFFFSVYIEGEVNLIDKIEKRKNILYELVKKYEKDNNNLSIENKMFEYAQKSMMIGIIKIETITAKAKFGQNMNDDEINIIIKDLEKRGEKLDFETIEIIKNMRK